MKKRWLSCLLLLLLTVVLTWGTAGCGTFMARRMAQAPNSYPTWFAPEAPVLLAFHPNFLTNFARQYVAVGPPAAKLCYRVIEPADYNLTVSSTNWLEDGLKRTAFDFHADMAGGTNAWTAHPRGTVVLLHGYALAQFSMVPWGLWLAQNGWRCVLVDLRGHGKSTGKRIYYGLREVHDLSQLLDHLADQRELTEPVAAFGESYGAVMALRWKPVEPRVRMVVAIAPYAVLSNTVLNLRSQYAGWLPTSLIKAGLRQLPSVLGTTADELDTTTQLSRHPVKALFVTADGDKIAPESDVAELRTLAAPGSKLIVVRDSTHETVTYDFADLTKPILQWLSNGDEPGRKSFDSGHTSLGR
ncbi:MAG TPA: alpha/beta fold hydrolase [Candidatus Acidoferrales bacterium]|nr:alpha/beta fold hydrolase [Candidatus Acidoferrales bacterium]